MSDFKEENQAFVTERVINLRKAFGPRVYSGNNQVLCDIQNELMELLPASEADAYAKLANMNFSATPDAGPPSEWEEKFLGTKYVQARTHARKSLLLSGVVGDDAYSRYKEGLFSSSVPSGPVLGNVYIELSDFLRIPLPIKKEEDPESPFSFVGRSDLTHAVFSQIDWTPSYEENSFQGVRSKIPGDRFVKVGTKMVGFQPFFVPEDFPVEVAEYYNGEYYIIYPYISFPFKFEGRSFVPHPFHSPNDYIKSDNADGTMFCIGGREFRSKKFATVDIDIEGITWEVVPSDTGIGFRKVRPRPGKTPTINHLSVVKSQLLEHHALSMMTPHPNHIVINVGSGSCKGTISIDIPRQRVTFDSCRRMDVKKQYPILISAVLTPKLKDVDSASFDAPSQQWEIVSKLGHSSTVPFFNLHSSETTSIESKVGAKALVLTANGKELLFKDKQKPWDWIGGSVELGETPLDALVREIEEETGFKADRAKIFPIGYSDEISDTGQRMFRSHLFVMRSFQYGDNWRDPSDPLTQDRQTWLKRYHSWLSTYGGETILDKFLICASSSFRLSSLLIPAMLVPFLSAANILKRSDPRADVEKLVEHGEPITSATLELLCPALGYSSKEVLRYVGRYGIIATDIVRPIQCLQCYKLIKGFNGKHQFHAPCHEIFLRREKERGVFLESTRFQEVHEDKPKKAKYRKKK
jgi:ADP-ribose pyrophosphatase YjhB (NUDIX family)